MAYDKTTGVLTIDSANETLDVILDNIASALGDYRVTEVAGVKARDVGLLCTSPNVNKWSLYKPFISSNVQPTDAERKAALYGWSIPKKSAGTNTLTYINQIRNMGKGADIWSYQRPTPSPSSWARLNDFNNYKSRALPFGQPIAAKRLAGSKIEALNETSITINLNKASANVGTYTYENFWASEYVILSAVVTKPAVDNSALLYDIDGFIQFELYGVEESSPYFTHSENISYASNQPYLGCINFMVKGNGLSYLKVTWNINNYSINTYPSNEYIDTSITVDITSANSIIKSKYGVYGIYIEPYIYDSMWKDAKTAVFGNGKPLAFIEVQYADSEVSEVTTVQKLISIFNESYILFSHMGIPDLSNRYLKSITIILLSGSDSIFPNMTYSNYISELSNADNYELFPFPQGYIDIDKIVEEDEFSVESGDFQYVRFKYDGYADDETITILTPNGARYTVDYDLYSFTWRQYILFDYPNATQQATFKIDLYLDNTYQTSNYQSATIKKGESNLVLFEVEVITTDAYKPTSWQIRISIIVNGITYYLNPYTQLVSMEETDLYQLGYYAG